MSSTRIGSVLISAGLAIGLAACSGPGASAPATDQSASASAPASSPSSATSSPEAGVHVLPRTTDPPAPDVQAAVIAAFAASTQAPNFSFSGRGELWSSAGPTSAKLTGQFSQYGADTAFKGSIVSGPDSTDSALRVVDGTRYLRIGDDPWQTGPGLASGWIAALGPDEVEYAGHERLVGSDVYLHRLRIDGIQILAPLTESVTDVTVSTSAFEVLADDAGTPVRIERSVIGWGTATSGPMAGQGIRLSQSLTIDVEQVGSVSPIEAPVP